MSKLRTFQDLYVSRCATVDGKLVPHFWQPMAMQGKKFCLFADERRPLHQPEVQASMQRLIALGLRLEIPVGQFIREQSKREVPKELYVKELLQSATADEARHDQGFRFAKDVYGLPSEADLAKADDLTKTWIALSNKYQPLAIAGVLEQQVFLVTLGLMRIVGGPELNDLAMQIAKDESRHVATNRAITDWLGVEFGKDVEQAVDETLDFACAGMSIKLTNRLTLDYDFCVKSSRSLLATGLAPELDKVTRIAQIKMPFELSNTALYTTRSTDSGQTVY